MNVYFACSSAELKIHNKEYLDITNHVNKLGHKIIVDWIKEAEKSTGSSDESIRRTGIDAITNSDILIAEVSLPSSSVGYQIALALSEKKPVLCLYSKEFGVKKPPSVIQANNSQFLTLSSYTAGSVDKVISDFFKGQTGKKLIKFNFIITPEINNYLNWISNMGKLSKSDLLREKVVKEIIAKDTEYQEYLLKDS